MREVLLKKRYGIPAALLALLALVGVATAVILHNFTYTANPEEPLTFDVIDALDLDYQGDKDDIIVAATNHSIKLGYGIFVDADVVSGQVGSITYSSFPLHNKLVLTENKSGHDVNVDGDKWDAWYNIEPDESYNIVVYVDTVDNVSPENPEVHLEFHRERESPPEVLTERLRKRLSGW